MAFDSIGNISLSVQNFGAYSLCNDIEFVEDKSFPFLLAQCVRDNYINWQNVEYITSKSHEMLWKSHCQKGQVLITMAGAYLGKSAVYTEDFICSSNQAIAKITLKASYNPYFISTFLGSEHGQNQINRLKTVTGQPNINMSLIKEILIPNLSQPFQTRIEALVKQAHAKLEESKNLYQEAEKGLLQELGVTDSLFASPAVNANVGKFSASQAWERLDAEYYQPKYEAIENLIRSYKGGICKVSACFSLNKDNADRTKEGYNYTEIGDIDVSNGKQSYNYVLTEYLPDNAKIRAYKGDLLVSKVRPNRGAISIVEFDKDLVVSGAFTVLMRKNSSPITTETLQVLLRTSVYGELLLKYNVGTSYPVIKDEDVLNLEIPILPIALQERVAGKVQASFAGRQASEQLLALAKQAVETAIEAGEAEAMRLLS